MIVSHSYRFVFVHCRKVAGSSMKVALAPSLGANDIIIGSLHEIERTGLAPPSAITRVLRLPGPAATALAARACGKSGPEARNIAVKRHFSRWLGPNSPHPTAEQARAFVGEAWADYAKFCFVRNPYERTASDFSWRRRSTGQLFTFAEYLAALQARDNSRGIIHSGAITNWEMMAIGDDLQIDFVGRYERIDQDFAQITAALGLPPLRLGVVKKATMGGRDYSTLYGPQERRKVAGIFAQEIERFSYDFPY